LSAERQVSQALITLLTDFGTSDHFVAAMKGVILSINPQATIVDITHETPPQDVAGAAFTLFAAYDSFPKGTVHVAVVDPGVGSSRRPILGLAGDHYFVGPDNGIFSYVFARERDVSVLHLDRDSYFRHPLSATFHGRDLFAPVAAALSNGVQPRHLGSEISDPVLLPSSVPQREGQGRFRGNVLHIDRFGNCITNFTPQDLPASWRDQRFNLLIRRKVIKTLRRYFAEGSDHSAEPFAIWGSAGFLEIAVLNSSAAELLNIERGQEVLLELQKQR
jgi:S-adenosylmethionine hydrolase